MLGFEVDVYEAKDNPSGLTVHGVAPYKITNEEAIGEIEYLQQQFGFEVHYAAPVIDANDFERLEGDYDCIFIGVGLGNTRSIGLPGENLTNCLGATEFIEDLRFQHHQAVVGQKVIVLGGGNTAMDAASESARMGATEVILAYRGSKERMSAYEFEFELAKGAGVQGWFNTQPVKILEENGSVSGVEFVRTQYVNGRPQAIEGSNFTEACDMVIRATGQEKQAAWLGQVQNLSLDERGCIAVNEQMQSSNPKYFAGGDAVNGGAEVVNAAYEGKMAAQGAASWLGVA